MIEKGLWQNGRMIELLNASMISTERRAIIEIVTSKLDEFDKKTKTVTKKSSADFTTATSLKH